jgi:1-acyl-sn-glycerol-3-phosphate acyltransferase
VSRLHQPKAGFWIRLCVMVLYPLDRLLFRLRFQHLDRVPAPSQGGVIIAINHISHVDTVLMARLVWQSGRVPRFMIKSGVFTKPVLGQVMRGAKQIPVYRGTTDASASLRDAVTALEQGEAIVIYPEGTITRDPEQWPMQGKTGIARLVLLAPDIPVVPVGQWGSQHLRAPILRRVFCRRVSEASVGEPLDLRRFRDADATAATLREVTDTIMDAIRDEVAGLRGEKPPEEYYKPASERAGKR